MSTLGELFLYFIIYAFLGWIIEVVFHVFTMKKIINRGFLYGPLCPIYGVGAVIMILILKNFSSSPIIVFIVGIIAASILEYITGYILEKVFQTRWWDYSDMKYNINGYISLSFSIAWGIASVFLIELLHPLIVKEVSKIPFTILTSSIPIIFIIFSIDLIFTIRSLIEFRDILLEVQNIKSELILKKLKLEKEISLTLGETKEDMEKKREELELQLKNTANTLLKEGLGKREYRFIGSHRRFLKSYPNLLPREVRKKIKSLLNRK